VTGWLLDTVVVSELRTPRCDPRVRRWSDGQPPDSLFLSRVTLAEILDVDEEVLVKWRGMVARGRAVNHTFSQPDLFIAASAAVHGLTVVTRNVVDFRVAGVPVLDPWSA
jgi:predicted nucleic acid-binding protein